jgi:hypothetical protein
MPRSTRTSLRIKVWTEAQALFFWTRGGDFCSILGEHSLLPLYFPFLPFLFCPSFLPSSPSSNFRHSLPPPLPCPCLPPVLIFPLQQESEIQPPTLFAAMDVRRWILLLFGWDAISSSLMLKVSCSLPLFCQANVRQGRGVLLKAYLARYMVITIFINFSKIPVCYIVKLLIASCSRLSLSVHIAYYNHQQNNYENKTVTGYTKELR